MFLSAIFLISASFYVGIEYGYIGYLRSEIETLNKDIASFSEQVPLGDQLALINFYSQLANIDALLANQVVGTRAFDWIEKNTHANVYLTGMSVDYVGSAVSTNPIAKTMSDALQQLVNLYRKPEVKQVGVGGIGQTADAEGGKRWAFGLGLKLDAGYFTRSYKPPRAATTSAPGMP